MDAMMMKVMTRPRTMVMAIDALPYVLIPQSGPSDVHILGTVSRGFGWEWR
jgi:hypothetical protein